MQIKKNNIIYDLDRYKRIYMNDQILALCLYDEESEDYGDYEAIYFETLEELQEAYNRINNNVQTGEVIDLDTPLFANRILTADLNNIVGEVTLGQPIINAVSDVIRNDSFIHESTNRIEELERKNEELTSQLQSMQSILEYILNKVEQ